MELLGELHLAGPTKDGEPALGEETGKGFISYHRVPPQASLAMLLPAHEASLQHLPALLLNTHLELS